MRIAGSRLTYAALLVTVLASSPAAAQVFGTFSWQMQPYCNRLTITLTNVIPGFALEGSDDQCGAPTKGAIVGVAVFNPNGSAGLNFTIVSSPGGQGVHVSAIVNPANGQGSWSDSAGNVGTFAFFGALPGLPVRPVATLPVDIADNPNQVTDPCTLGTVMTAMQLCGTSGFRWLNGSPITPGRLQVWRDSLGQVHIRGSATRSSGSIDSFVFVLPPELRPRRVLSFQVGTGFNGGVSQTGSAMLLILPRDNPEAPGLVRAYDPSTVGHTVVNFGEIIFRVDQ